MMGLVRVWALLMVLVMALGVSAQEAQEVATEILGQPPEGVVVPPVSEGDTEPISPARMSELVIHMAVAVGGILAAIMVAAGGGIILVVRNLNQNTRVAIEQLALSLPPGTLLQLRDIIATVREVAEVADELTDGRLQQGQQQHS